MKEPVLFLAFANNEQEPVLDILEENNAIYDSLLASDFREKFDVHRDQFTTSRNILDKLIAFNQRISIFHFAGHSANAHLYLMDQQVKGKGLTDLLAMQSSLRFVFLNGCNTSGLVGRMLDAGVPVVLATTRKVNDKKAIELAANFYKSLFSGASIGESFAFAKAALEARGEAEDDTISLRGIRLPEQPSAEFPWGLYYQKSEGLDWRLEDAEKDLNPIPSGFWWRLAVIVLLAFGLFTLANVHLGYENTAMYLAVGPLALVAIITTLIKAFGKRFPAILHALGNPFLFFLKTPVLLLLTGIVFLVSITLSSARIGYSGESPPDWKLYSSPLLQNEVWTWPSESGKNVRIMTTLRPFTEEKFLYIQGYEPEGIRFRPIVPAKLHFDSLRADPVVFLRLHPSKLSVRERLRVRITRQDTLLFDGKFNSKGALQIGNPHLDAVRHRTDFWSRELGGNPDYDEEMRNYILQSWSDPHNWKDKIRLNRGERLRCEVSLLDSLIIQMPFQIGEANITDLILK